MYWASDIEWPVVRHSRYTKNKGIFERLRICALQVARRGLAVVAICECQNKRGYFIFEIVEISKLGQF